MVIVWRRADAGSTIQQTTTASFNTPPHSSFKAIAPSNLAQALKVLTRILGVAGSTFRLDTERHQVLRGFLQSLQASVDTAIKGRPLLFTTAFSSIHYSLIILPIDATQPTIFVRGFVHRGFAYSCKDYCGSPHASRWRSSLIRDSTCVTARLYHSAATYIAPNFLPFSSHLPKMLSRETEKPFFQRLRVSWK
jgi:hypothetical protein